MKQLLVYITKYWHRILAACIIIGQAIILYALGDRIYTGICDNLDLFIAQLKVLADNHAFFGSNVTLPILGGLERNYFPSELSLYNLMYAFLPPAYAYITGLVLKPVIALFSSITLAKYLLGESYKYYEAPVFLCALSFGMLPLYPAYSFCFVSLPWLLFLLIKAYREPSFKVFLGLFIYPLVSYFSFFGIFILGYLSIAIVALWIRDKKIPKSICQALLILTIGYVCFEYRLFYLMLFSDVETIRSTMVIASFDGKQLLDTFMTALYKGVAHAETIHQKIVLPSCLAFMVILSVHSVRRKKPGLFFIHPFMLTIYFIIFNAAVYALYYFEPLRNLFETLLPPLKGFSYGRTIFFNAFAWYFAFFFLLKDLWESKKLRWLSVILGLLALAYVGKTQTQYNDLYNSVFCNYYKEIKGGTPNQLSFKEFYGGNLFEQIKVDINYDSKADFEATQTDKTVALHKPYAAAFGFHPATLQYNGIATVDGYCGYYSLDYKDRFRKVIEPTLDNNAGWEYYYDSFGYRAYLFSNDGSNTYDFGASSAIGDPRELNINSNALRDLDCEYIFSRFEITNADALGLSFINVYADESVPYVVYLYEL